MPFGNTTPTTGLRPELGMPAITPVTPVATPDAVEKLNEAFHRGVINAQDIMDRLGPLGQSERAAKIQSWRELVDPKAVQARKNILNAQNEEALLRSIQLKNAMEMTPPQAYEEKLKHQKAAAEAIHGAGSDEAYVSWKGIFEPDLPYDTVPDAASPYGQSPDYITRTKKGQQWRTDAELFQYAQKVLTPVGEPMKLQVGNQLVSVYKNAYGQPITDALKQGMQPYMSRWKAAFEQESSPVKPKGVGGKTASANQWYQLEPGTGTYVSLEGQQKPVISVGETQATKAVSDQGLTSRQTGQPVTSDYHIPVRDPSGKLPKETLVPGATGPAPDVLATQKPIRDALMSSPQVQAWGKAQDTVNSFLREAQYARDHKGEVLGDSDFALAKNLFYLMNPNVTRVPEAQWKELTQVVPFFEQFKSLGVAIDKATHRVMFTPEARERIVDLGLRHIEGQEQSVRNAVDDSVKQIWSSPWMVNEQDADNTIPVELRRVWHGVSLGQSLGVQSQHMDKTQTAPAASSGLKDYNNAPLNLDANYYIIPSGSR